MCVCVCVSVLCGKLIISAPKFLNRSTQTDQNPELMHPFLIYIVSIIYCLCISFIYFHFK